MKKLSFMFDLLPLLIRSSPLQMSFVSQLISCHGNVAPMQAGMTKPRLRRPRAICITGAARNDGLHATRCKAWAAAGHVPLSRSHPYRPPWPPPLPSAARRTSVRPCPGATAAADARCPAGAGRWRRRGGAANKTRNAALWALWAQDRTCWWSRGIVQHQVLHDGKATAIDGHRWHMLLVG